MKKLFAIIMVIVMAMTTLTGCGKASKEETGMKTVSAINCLWTGDMIETTVIGAKMELHHVAAVYLSYTDDNGAHVTREVSAKEIAEAHEDAHFFAIWHNAETGKLYVMKTPFGDGTYYWDYYDPTTDPIFWEG